MISETLHEEPLHSFLNRYARALSAGDIAAVAGFWEVPALVLSDEGGVAVTTQEQLEEFFGRAWEWYRSKGLLETRAEVLRIEMLGDRLVSMDVRWPAFDATGKEAASETSRYVVRLDESGHPRIRVAMTTHPPH